MFANISNMLELLKVINFGSGPNSKRLGENNAGHLWSEGLVTCVTRDILVAIANSQATVNSNGFFVIHLTQIFKKMQSV